MERSARRVQRSTAICARECTVSKCALWERGRDRKTWLAFQGAAPLPGDVAISGSVVAVMLAPCNGRPLSAVQTFAHGADAQTHRRDLHDDIGSGLSKIVILNEVALRNGKGSHAVALDRIPETSGRCSTPLATWCGRRMPR